MYPVLTSERKNETVASVREIIPSEQMLFDNAPLEEVLNKLAQHHTVAITYNPEELKGTWLFRNHIL